jgi:hypothetical protein
MVGQNIQTKGFGEQYKMNPCKRWHKLTLIEVLLNKVQWHPEN